jgi:hypothetical protein
MAKKRKGTGMESIGLADKLRQGYPKRGGGFIGDPAPPSALVPRASMSGPGNDYQDRMQQESILNIAGDTAGPRRKPKIKKR